MPVTLLKEYRLRKGYSQEKLALLSRISMSQIQKIELGKCTNPHRETMIRIAEILEADPIAIFFPELPCQSQQ